MVDYIHRKVVEESFAVPIFGRLKVGSEDDLVRINDAAWRILGRVGMKIYSKRLLSALKSFGVRVDDRDMTARFPVEMIRSAVRCELRPERPDSPILVSKGFQLGFGEVCFFLLDWKSGERRPATREESVQMIRLGDAMPEVASIATPVVNSQVDQRVEALEAAELLLSNTNKSAGTGIRCPEQVNYFEEINRICEKHGDKRRFSQPGGCLTTPLTLGQRTAGIIERYMDLGYRDFGFSSMPIAGGNAPVTTAGCAALGVAELLGGSLVAHAINPQMAGTGVGMIISGTMDMTRGRASFCSPQALMQDALVHRVFQRLYGIGVSLDSAAGYINAKMPGLQCAYERTFKQMALAGVTGRLGMHAGSLDGAAIFSPVQAMIDVELCRGLWQFYKGANISEDTLALDEIERIGVGEGKSFLDSEHTLKHFRGALWLPKLLDISMWRDHAESTRERGMLEKADHRWREILGAWKRPDINDDMIAEVHEVVERAKREIPQESA